MWGWTLVIAVWGLIKGIILDFAGSEFEQVIIMRDFKGRGRESESERNEERCGVEDRNEMKNKREE